jgi:crotonobetainyl-CoA:carnitine CoA-transferase CaiB-like acyl-CoA transferase
VTESRGPLDGLLVVDLSTTFMGPYCSLLLGQLGARVVKVESPGGDIARYIGDRRGTGLGPIFMNGNRGKESVVLDLKDAGDREVLDGLIGRADVFMHNLRPQAMERLELDATTVLERNPRVVYCHTLGFGSAGPYRDRAAYDDVVQAVSGVAAVQGGDGDPQYVRTAVADKTVGLMAMGAILAALYEREGSGRGQAVEIPMFESMASYMLLEQQGDWLYADRPGPAGYARTASPYRKPYRTADGHIGLLVYTDQQWRSFFRLVGRDDLAEDERYTTIRGRTDHIDELYAMLEELLGGRSTAEWLELFEQHHIPAMPVNRIEDLFDDEHLRAVGLFERVEHPTEGPVVQARLPWSFSRTPGTSGPPAPALGEHTTAVLAELGLTSAGEAPEQRGHRTA